MSNSTVTGTAGARKSLLLKSDRCLVMFFVMFTVRVLHIEFYVCIMRVKERVRLHLRKRLFTNYSVVRFLVGWPP